MELVLLIFLALLIPLLLAATYRPKAVENTDPLEAQVAALDNPQTRASAERVLLSRGPSKIPWLLDQLSRIDLDPPELTPRQQIAIEELLRSFGLRTWQQMHRRIKLILRSAPLYPATLRILEGLMPHLLTTMARQHQAPAVALLMPLIVHARQAWPEEHAFLCHHWPQWRLLDPLDGLQESPDSPPLEIEALIATLLQEGHAKREASLDDPRIREAIIQQAEAPQSEPERAAMALWCLSQDKRTPLLEIWVKQLTFVSSSSTSEFYLRATLRARPDLLLAALQLLTRDAQVVRRVLRLVPGSSVTAYLNHWLKGLGVHRYQPSELLLLGPLVSRWEEIEDGVIQCLAHPQREIANAAIQLITYCGRAEHILVLIEAMGINRERDLLIANAVELLATLERGSSMLTPLPADRDLPPLLARTKGLWSELKSRSDGRHSFLKQRSES